MNRQGHNEKRDTGRETRERGKGEGYKGGTTEQDTQLVCEDGRLHFVLEIVGVRDAVGEEAKPPPVR